MSALPPVHPLPPVHASVVHMLAEAADDRPAAPAIRFEGSCLNYAQYASAVGALARRWSALVRPGDRIVLVLPNSLDLAIATFAAHALRAQVVPLNPAYPAREMAFMLADAAPALIVYDENARADVGQLAGRLDGVRRVSVRAGAAFASLADERCPLPLQLPGHEELATLQYTGGTTGRPKGVDITHRQLAWNLAQREALLPTEHGAERMLCTMPLFHVSAVAMCLHLSCRAASELVIHRRFDAQAALAAIARDRITLMSAAPAIYHDLVAHPATAQTDLGSLRACYSGAAPLPARTLERWEALGGSPIYEGYGMSEAGPCMTYNPFGGPRKIGSVGIPVPASELEIVDPDGGTLPLPPGQPGEIRVRGPHVMAGYRNLPELTAATLREGWLHTGDIAERDEDGYVFIKARKHDTINVGGFKVYPREVEEVLLASDDVAEAAVFGVTDARLGEVVQAWVVPRAGCAVDPDALVALCRERMIGYKVPRAIGVTGAIPRTSVGKLARTALQPVVPPATVEH